jgi:hypothetical protein
MRDGENFMSDTLKPKAKEPLNLAYEVSDEALESAAMLSGATKNYTLTFCSTPWTCPTAKQEERSASSSSRTIRELLVQPNLQ